MRFRIELGKEELSVVAEERGHEAEFARFLGRHEVAPHIVRRGQGLVFLHAPAKAVKEASVGEGDVGEARGRYGDIPRAARQEVLHDALGCAHHVDGVGRLVGGYAEIFPSSFFCCHAHGFVGVENVDVDHAHEGPGILFAAHMLECRKVEHIVVARPIGHEGVEDVAARVDGEGGELTVGVADRRAQVAHQLHHVVFGDVHHVQKPRIAPEDFARHGLADRACGANN